MGGSKTPTPLEHRCRRTVSSSPRMTVLSRAVATRSDTLLLFGNTVYLPLHDLWHAFR
jgi:hypothetical protein